MRMSIVGFVLQFVGSLGFLLYGMKLMSDGIQKSAGQSLKRALGFMTRNRFVALITGMVLTMIIQSSGATTVMVVSFVNAGLLTLAQSVGVIFGANIGTTITAWIVALFDFSGGLNISAYVIPLFGMGYVLKSAKRLRKENVGEALMGFAMLFMGLGMLSSAIAPESGVLDFMVFLDDWGFLSIIIGALIGVVITALLHSSSATTAIVITMAEGRLLTWEFSAALVIGSEIGSTVDAVLAARGAKVGAKRAAFIHVMFNVIMAVCALILFRPLLRFVDFIIPGAVSSNVKYHIAMLHTTLKTITALVFLPFTRQIAAFAERVIRPGADETARVYRLEFSETGSKENVAARFIRVEKEIADMTELVARMFGRIESGISERNQSFIDKHFAHLDEEEEYADQMQEQLSNYLIHCSRLPLNERQANNINVMLQIVDELENMTDDCMSVGLLIKRSIEQQMQFEQEDMDRLVPYIDLSHQFLVFIRENINKRLTEEKLVTANEIEEQIDMFRHNLKKVARKRLESGANVKAELLYIDLVRQIEKFGDCAFSISEALAQTR